MYRHRDLATVVAALPTPGLWPQERGVVGYAAENFLTFILRKRQAAVDEFRSAVGNNSHCGCKALCKIETASVHMLNDELHSESLLK